MKNKNQYNEFDLMYQQNYVSTGNKYKVQEWIFNKIKKEILKKLSTALKCKKKNISYSVNVCSKKSGDGCENNHKDVWYGKMDIVDFFRKAQKDNPGCWMCVTATSAKKIEDINDSPLNGNDFWIADAYSPDDKTKASTDVGGLISYLWEHALDVDEMSDEDRKLPWGPSGDYYGEIS